MPDAPGQLTSDHGWDLRKDGERVRPIIAELRQAGIRVSLFMDTDLSPAIPGILEVSIGHAIVVEAFDCGLEETLKRYLEIVGL